MLTAWSLISMFMCLIITPNAYCDVLPLTDLTGQQMQQQQQQQHQQQQQQSKLPVVVFIQAESYDWGSGNLLDRSVLSIFNNVILVTLNYRLGLFGFLPVSLDENGPRGNYGLMDQVAALHWIQENIADFGGDPMNITLIGHGYGAAFVNFLVISPMVSSSLFSRVILMSGSALSPWALARDADFYSRVLAKGVNCPILENYLMVECLRSKSMEELQSVDLKVPEHITAFGPIIDSIVIPSEPRSLISAVNEHQHVYYSKVRYLSVCDDSPFHD